MELRDYQHKAISLARAALYRHAAVIICAPVGSGKTVIACEMIRQTLARGNRCVFLVHRAELVTQAYDRLAAFGIRAGIIKAGFDEDRSWPVQVACIPTLIRRELPDADLVIVDECHHVSSDSWMSVVGGYKDSGAKIVGLSATPCRLDGKPLGEIFSEIVAPVSVTELIEAGHLVRPQVWAPPVDLSGIRISMGDYRIDDLEQRVNKLTGSLIKHWMRHAKGKKTVVFAVTVAHSKQIRDEFREHGIAADHIDGTTPAAERTKSLAMLRSGETDVLCNVMVLTEGWDLPELECVVLARPTQSFALFRQMVGRVMRPPGPVILLDHAGNTRKHGSVEDEVEWSLAGKAKKKPTDPTHTCTECFAVFDAWIKAKWLEDQSIVDEDEEEYDYEEVFPNGDPSFGPPRNLSLCPACFCAAPSSRVSLPETVEGDLVQVEQTPKKAIDRELWYRRTVIEATINNRKIGWARYRYKERYGSWPKFYGIEKEYYRCSGHVWEATQFGIICSRCRAKKHVHA